MLLFETVKTPFGDLQRLSAPITSSTLLALPDQKKPNDVLCCTSCPAASWNLDETDLACHCNARHYVSWVPKQKMLILCDDREKAVAELDPNPED